MQGIIFLRTRKWRQWNLDPEIYVKIFYWLVTSSTGIANNAVKKYYDNINQISSSTQMAVPDAISKTASL